MDPPRTLPPMISMAARRPKSNCTTSHAEPTPFPTVDWTLSTDNDFLNTHQISSLTFTNPPTEKCSATSYRPLNQRNQNIHPHPVPSDIPSSADARKTLTQPRKHDHHAFLDTNNQGTLSKGPRSSPSSVDHLLVTEASATSSREETVIVTSDASFRAPSSHNTACNTFDCRPESKSVLTNLPEPIGQSARLTFTFPYSEPPPQLNQHSSPTGQTPTLSSTLCATSWSSSLATSLTPIILSTTTQSTVHGDKNYRTIPQPSTRTSSSLVTMSTSPAREGGASSPTVGSPRLAPSLGDHLGGSGSAGATGSPPSNTAATTGSATMTTTTTTTNTTTTTTTTNATSAATVSSSNSSISPSSSGILSGSGITVVAGSQHSGSSGLLGTSSNTTSATSIVTSTAGKGTILSSATSALGLGSSGVSDIKLKKYLEHNQRLREQLEMGRISVSEASKGLIKYVTTTKDALIPSLWGMPASDPFSKKSSGCCTIS